MEGQTYLDDIPGPDNYEEIMSDDFKLGNCTYQVKLVIERIEDGDIRNSCVVINCQDADSAQSFFYWADCKLGEAFERVGDFWSRDDEYQRSDNLELEERLKENAVVR